MRTKTLANGFELEVYATREGERVARYSSVGCYPLFYLDGRDNVLCAECAQDAIDAFEDGDDSRELPAAGGVNWENLTFYCECGNRIESAYAEDDA